MDKREVIAKSKECLNLIFDEDAELASRVLKHAKTLSFERLEHELLPLLEDKVSKIRQKRINYYLIKHLKQKQFA